jgi:hypothetical protein
VRDRLLALLMLVVMPRLMSVPLIFLFHFAPDIFWLTLAVASLPVGWSGIQTVVALVVLQRNRARSTTAEPVAA